MTAKSLRQVGLLVFEFIGERQLMEVHVYSTDDFVGTVVESEGRSYLLSTCHLLLPKYSMLYYSNVY